MCEHALAKRRAVPARELSLAFLTIGSGDGDCVPAPSHTTGRTLFRIRRLDPAAYLLAARCDGITNP